MTMGIVGRKCGMTRVFTDDGVSIPVTVIEAQPNRITQVKTVETDGYRALQVTAGSRKASHVSKPQAGHLAKAKVEAGDLVMEFRLDDADEGEFELGSAKSKSSRSQKARKLTSSVRRSVKALPAPSSATTSACRMLPTATRWRIARRAQSVRTRRRAAFSKARKWPAIWEMCAAPCKTLRSFVSMTNAICLLIKGAVPGHAGGKVFVRPAVKSRN